MTPAPDTLDADGNPLNPLAVTANRAMYLATARQFLAGARDLLRLARGGREDAWPLVDSTLKDTVECLSGAELTDVVIAAGHLTTSALAMLRDARGLVEPGNASVVLDEVDATITQVLASLAEPTP